MSPIYMPVLSEKKGHQRDLFTNSSPEFVIMKLKMTKLPICRIKTRHPVLVEVSPLRRG